MMEEMYKMVANPEILDEQKDVDIVEIDKEGIKTRLDKQIENKIMKPPETSDNT